MEFFSKIFFRNSTLLICPAAFNKSNNLPVGKIYRLLTDTSSITSRLDSKATDSTRSKKVGVDSEST
jgi:hypothetical protein